MFLWSVRFNLNLPKICLSWAHKICKVSQYNRSYVTAVFINQPTNLTLVGLITSSMNTKHWALNILILAMNILSWWSGNQFSIQYAPWLSVLVQKNSLGGQTMSPNCSQQSSVDANVSLRRQRWGTTKLIEQGCSKSRVCDYESCKYTGDHVTSIFSALIVFLHNVEIPKQYRIIHFFPSGKFSSKKYSCKIICTQTKWTKIILQVACGDH